MEETKKITAIIGLTVLMSLIGSAISGLFGAVMGFVLTLLIIGLFTLWKNM